MNSRYDCFANPLIRVFALLTVLSLVSFHGRQSGAAEPPGILSHQGRIAVDGVNFSGTGQFKFALVNGAGDNSHWSNDSTSTAGGEPTASVAVAITKGHYALLLGEAPMTVIPSSVFVENSDVRLRIWFSSNGGTNFEKLTPDRRISPVGYAMVAKTALEVPAGAISAGMIADGAITSEKISAGSITGTHISDGTIQAGHLMPGAVTDSISAGTITGEMIAVGSIDSSKLNKAPQAGRVDAANLPFSMEPVPFSVTFPNAFATPPTVTTTAALNSHPLRFVATISSASTEGFSGLLAAAQDPSRILDGLDGNEVNSEDVIMIDLNGKPAVGYYAREQKALRFIRALDENGNSWSNPVSIPSSEVRSFALTLVDGRPAFCFTSPVGAPESLRYVRSNNASGSSWGSNTIITNNVTGMVSMAIVAGRPVIAYNNAVERGVNVIRSTDNVGSNWSGPTRVAEASSQYTSLNEFILTEVAGHPALMFRLNAYNNLRFIRATNQEGTSWGSSLLLDSTGKVTASDKDIGSIAIIDGNPAVAYTRYFSDSSYRALAYVRANNPTGSSWGNVVEIESSSVTNISEHPSLTIVGGVPTIAYLSSSDLKVVKASDTTGTSWNSPVRFGPVWGNLTVKEISGNPFVSYHDSEHLRFLPLSFSGSINWIAMEP